MTKERQTQIMKPIKVLSLVLLALFLFVPAASAETYTLIDEDLVFGGDSLVIPSNVQTSSYFIGFSVKETTSSSSVDYWYLDEERTFDDQVYSLHTVGVWHKGSRLTEYTFDNPYVLEIPSYQEMVVFDFVPRQLSTYSSVVEYVRAVEDYISDFSKANPWAFVCTHGLQSNMRGYAYVYPLPNDESAIQHVTVTYTEESENYQIYVDTSDESVDVWVHGYIFGWFPVFTFSSNSFPPSTHFEWLSLPLQFMLFGIDWEVKVECDGESQVLKWNQDTLPIDVTPPDPYPPSDPDLPDEPDPPDPTEPPEDPPHPPWYNPSGGEGGGGSFDGQTFRELFTLPESLLDLVNFDLKQIRSDLLADIPIFEDIALGWFDAVDGFGNVVFGFGVGILVTIFKPFTDLFGWLSDVVEWFYNLCFGFTDYLYIPNHILSYLVQFVPNEILNLAGFLFALDIVVGLLSIVIPDIRYVYNVAVSYVESRKPLIPVDDNPPSYPYLGTELDIYHSEYWGDNHLEGHNYDYHQDTTKDGRNYEWRNK